MSVSIESTEAGRSGRPAFAMVWDPFVRLFHWSLVSFFALTWISADEWDRLHEVTGYIVAGLVGLRVIWGLIGTRHARFSDFVYGPQKVLAYLRDNLRGKAKRYRGHNPAGGAMVVALLLCFVMVSVTGIILATDVAFAGDWVEDLHEVTANLTLGLVLLHIVGVVYSSRAHKENLVASMITGLKRDDY